jgi:hypothetical protein
MAPSKSNTKAGHLAELRQQAQAVAFKKQIKIIQKKLGIKTNI